MESSQSLIPKPPTVVMIPSPGMGHLIPMIEFAKRLVVHDLCVAFVIPSDGPPSKPQRTVFLGLPPSIPHTFLPPVSLSELPDTSRIETIISLTVARSLPFLRDAFRLLSESHRLTAVAVDLFGTDAFDVAREFGVSPFIFFPSTAMALSLFLYLPQLDEEVQCEYRELEEPVRIPGCIPVHGRDLLDPVQDRKNDAYKWLLHHSKRYHLAEGIIENSFTELEPGAIKTFQKNEPGSHKPPLYPVGPLVNMDNAHSEIDGSGCLKWLDDQPHGSVLFISFGSGGALSTAQINELALGLEMSEQRFLWVVRSPNDGTANANYFNAESEADPFGFLPKGFVGRTKGRGFLVPSWAPQAQVLRHGSTGGFLTHCGWNSILESVVNGVPLVAWPLYAEQRMNAVMVTQDVKVALRPKASEGVAGRHEVAKVVKDLMEGEEGKKLRYRMKDLKEAADKALSENGSSTKYISELATVWKNK
ncbi:LOW QUALITY PROTEIN: hydroquinone glucosyltransferase [Prosopis cineraria]|uniref:LOW QUALITY PROTEIN: hydroquinone glucosyltransferase n=1 Tax=Prosopis cineraria TaxID=364024 RepID=UPI002410A27A|nr:LOW QUALITY PROTEIN: hydroquinone glucosyltransferase [Prosopis cineraria]